MTPRRLQQLKEDGIDPDKIKKASMEIFDILVTNNFNLKEASYLLSSTNSILGLLTRNDSLRKVGDFNYVSSVKEMFDL